MLLAATSGGFGGVVHDLGTAAGAGVATGAVGELRKPDDQLAAARGVQRASQSVGVGLGRGLIDEGVAVASGRVTVDDVAGRAAGLDPSTRPAGSP